MKSSSALAATSLAITGSMLLASDIADESTLPIIPEPGVEILDGDMVVRLRPGKKFEAGAPFLFSVSGKMSLQINEQGELTSTYAGADLNWKEGKGGAYVKYQAEDGNFCLYDKNDRFVWGSMIHGDHVKNGSIVLTSHGDLIQYDNAGKEVWRRKSDPRE